MQNKSRIKKQDKAWLEFQWIFIDETKKQTYHWPRVDSKKSMVKPKQSANFWL